MRVTRLDRASSSRSSISVHTAPLGLVFHSRGQSACGPKDTQEQIGVVALMLELLAGSGSMLNIFSEKAQPT
jgi:hypothetical protein